MRACTRASIFLRILVFVQIGSRVFSGTTMLPEGVRRYAACTYTQITGVRTSRMGLQ